MTSIDRQLHRSDAPGTGRRVDAVPRHVALIPDGNRRRARRENRDLAATYIHASRVLRRLCCLLVDRGVEYVTVWPVSSGFTAAIEDLKAATARLQRDHIILAFDYCGREEIVRAVRKMLENGAQAAEVWSELIGEHLDTAEIADPRHHRVHRRRSSSFRFHAVSGRIRRDSFFEDTSARL